MCHMCHPSPTDRSGAQSIGGLAVESYPALYMNNTYPATSYGLSPVVPESFLEPSVNGSIAACSSLTVFASNEKKIVWSCSIIFLDYSPRSVKRTFYLRLRNSSK